MNIYICDKDPGKAAQALDDKRLTDAVFLAGDVMSTALHTFGLWNVSFPRPRETNHPSMMWVTESRNNFRWYYHYANTLCEEFKFRFGMYPASHGIIQRAWTVWNAMGASRPLKREMTPFANVSIYHKEGGNDGTVEAYRQQLCEKEWGTMSHWQKREKPSWFYLKNKATA